MSVSWAPVSLASPAHERARRGLRVLVIDRKSQAG
jgi:hypothetical protein